LNTINKKSFYLFLTGLIFFFASISHSQQDLTPVNDNVYVFLKRMQLSGLIPQYNSSNLPLSRLRIAYFLEEIDIDKDKLAAVDKNILNEYLVDYSYEITGKVKAANILEEGVRDIFSQKNKYLYYDADTFNSLFINSYFGINQKVGNGDSLGHHKITLGEAGIVIRGTFRNVLGYYLKATNGEKLIGDSSDIQFAINNDIKYKANNKFVLEKKNFDSFRGYLRFAPEDEWISVWIGREQINQGFGYMDKLYYSNNTIPFDLIKLDLNFKKVNYSFSFGTLKGDSLGRDIPTKIIASHRLNLNLFESFKLGFFESIVSTSTPFSITYLNPISFLTSADLNTGQESTQSSNTSLGLDFEYVPIKNLGLQWTFLIDDINLKTVFKNDSTYNDNKFGYQLGMFWNDAFTLPGLTFTTEYTRLDPFVYSHRSNKSNYTNWALPLGHHIESNSDEIAGELQYFISNRFNVKFRYGYTRHGSGFILDSLGNLVRNFGGDINFGEGDQTVPVKNTFLQGYRINSNNFSLSLNIQPLKQFFIDLNFQYWLSDYAYKNQKYKDFYFNGYFYFYI
jgi:hypothetical protein